jgi:hypothetical protein
MAAAARDRDIQWMGRRLRYIYRLDSLPANFFLDMERTSRTPVGMGLGRAQWIPGIRAALQALAAPD